MSQSMFFYHARKFSASQQKTPRFKTNVHGYLSMKYLKNWWHKEMVLFKFSSLHIFWIKSTCEIEWKQREIKNVYVHKPRAGALTVLRKVFINDYFKFNWKWVKYKAWFISTWALRNLIVTSQKAASISRIDQFLILKIFSFFENRMGISCYITILLRLSILKLTDCEDNLKKLQLLKNVQRTSRLEAKSKPIKSWFTCLLLLWQFKVIRKVRQ